METTRRASAGRPTAQASSPAFRPDIEGLRGLAVGLVVLYHAGLGTLEGGFVGVDVFFVISGFLITGLLLREVERDGTINLRDFYARRMRRLVPAGALVLVLTMVATVIIANPLDRSRLLVDGAASALSLGNFRFAAAASDYFASVSSPSPFLHFWSLGVEEQFYLVWPALVLAAGVAAGRGRARIGVGGLLAAIVVASFVVNVWLTDASVNWAFYSLPSRAWQLAGGGLVAVIAVRPDHIPSRARAALGWTGLILIAGAALALNDTQPYPGAVALAPTMGTIAALLAGGNGAARVLLQPPLRFLGRISYSLYLWHWPVLVLLGMTALAPLTPVTTGIAIVVAMAAATLSWRFVESPFRVGHSSRGTVSSLQIVQRGLTVLIALTVLAGGMAWREDLALTGSAPITPVGTPDPSRGPGATGAAGSGALASQGPAETPTSYGLPPGLQPAPGDARSDTTEAELRADGCMGLDADSSPPPCVYGDPAGQFTVALVGDSHASNWFSVLDSLAATRGWRLVTFTKVRCPFLDIPMQNVALKREYKECEAWDRAVVDLLNAEPPDLTLISTDRNWIAPLDPAEATAVAEGESQGRLIARLPGRVAIIVDTPIADKDVPACLAANPADFRACFYSRSVGYGNAIGVREATAAAMSGAALIDLNVEICPGDPCPPIINEMLVFRDNSHLTRTFSMSLLSVFSAAIDAVLGGRSSP